jgi:CubicO group peptidase (beta-lactamase class C family)
MRVRRVTMPVVVASIALGFGSPREARPTGATVASIPAEVRDPVAIVNTEAELVQSLGRVVDRLVDADKFSGVVLVSPHGKPLLERAVGQADRERQRANTVATPFALASVSKMFTAVVVAQLVDQGLISLDATIGSLLPTYPRGEASQKVTVYHLLTMSSGIPDLFRSPRFWADVASIRAFPDFWPHFAHAPLAFQPGTKGAYSNSNFLILGAVIERRLGRPFIEVVEERIFRATDMTSTGYRSSAFRNAAVGYTRRPEGSGAGTGGDSGQWHRAWADPFAASDPSAADDAADCLPCSPMGGGYSTARDLARFAGAVMDRRLLGPDMTRRALAGYVAANEYPGKEGYGFETRLVGGVRIAGHRGGFRGIANRVEFYPDLGYVVVVLGNRDGDGAETIAAHVRTQIAASPTLSRERR